MLDSQVQWQFLKAALLAGNIQAWHQFLKQEKPQGS